jgi:hypothetical protein
MRLKQEIPENIKKKAATDINDVKAKIVEISYDFKTIENGLKQFLRVCKKKTIFYL